MSNKYTAQEIQEANDKFRRNLLTPDRRKGRVVFASGIMDSPDFEKIAQAVINFNAFTDGNDPHGEHDWAAFTIGDERYNFKIDYYDNDGAYEDGGDPFNDEVKRVLTIMSASDY